MAQVTNDELIFRERCRLMAEGVIKGSGQVVELLDGSTVEMPEEIHTFAHWKTLGYSVRKGEKAITSLGIWKYITKKKKDAEQNSDDGDGGENGYCKLKTAFFFTRAQVEPLKA